MSLSNARDRLVHCSIMPLHRVVRQGAEVAKTRNRRRGRPTTAASPFSRAIVVDAALALIDEAGLEALTMRALSERLGTFPATVYWHVGNRDELLLHVTDRVAG